MSINLSLTKKQWETVVEGVHPLLLETRPKELLDAIDWLTTEKLSS